MHIRLGTRGSLLARWQAQWVAAALAGVGNRGGISSGDHPGDQLQTPIGAGQDRGLFTKEIERELLAGRIDLAVHSLKDLPTDETPGLLLAAVPERAAAGDALVSLKYAGLDELPSGAGSGDRQPAAAGAIAQRSSRSRTHDLRGNIDTRLRKLDEGAFDAVILAEAGLRRLGMAERITQSAAHVAHAAGGGTGRAGHRTRAADAALREALAPLDHAPTRQAVLAERAMLAALHGGCLAPIAAYAQCEGDSLRLTGRVLSADGLQKIEAAQTASPAAAVELGQRVAAMLQLQGADALIEAARLRP